MADYFNGFTQDDTLQPEPTPVAVAPAPVAASLVAAPTTGIVRGVARRRADDPVPVAPVQPTSQGSFFPQNGAALGNPDTGTALGIPADVQPPPAPSIPGLDPTPKAPAIPGLDESPLPSSSEPKTSASLPASSPNPSVPAAVDGTSSTAAIPGLEPSQKQSTPVVSSSPNPTSPPPTDKPYDVDGNGNLKFNPSNLRDGILQANKAGVVSDDAVKQLLPQAQAVEDAHAELVKAAGGNSEAKAAIEGLTKGGAGVGGYFAGAAGGAAIGAAIPVLGETGISELIGGLIGAGVSVYAANRLERHLSKYSDAVKSFQASAQLHPYIAGGAQLAANLPLAASSVSNLAGLAQVGGTRAVATQLAKGAVAGALVEGVARPAIENVGDIALDAAGVEHDPTQAPTAGSILQNALFGAVLSGHGLQDTAPNQATLANIAQRGLARETNVGPDGKPQPIPLGAQFSNIVADAQNGPLSLSEQALYSQLKQAAKKYGVGLGDALSGENPNAVSARQITTKGGTPLATQAEIGARPELPPSPTAAPDVPPAAPTSSAPLSPELQQLVADRDLAQKALDIPDASEESKARASQFLQRINAKIAARGGVPADATGPAAPGIPNLPGPVGTPVGKPDTSIQPLPTSETSPAAGTQSNVAGTPGASPGPANVGESTPTPAIGQAPSVSDTVPSPNPATPSPELQALQQTQLGIQRVVGSEEFSPEIRQAAQGELDKVNAQIEAFGKGAPAQTGTPQTTPGETPRGTPGSEVASTSPTPPVSDTSLGEPEVSPSAQRSTSTPSDKAGQITQAFAGMGKAGEEAGRARVVKQLASGETVTFSKGADAARNNPNYRVAENPDGSVTVTDAVDPATGKWHSESTPSDNEQVTTQPTSEQDARPSKPEAPTGIQGANQDGATPGTAVRESTGIPGLEPASGERTLTKESSNAEPTAAPKEEAQAEQAGSGSTGPSVAPRAKRRTDIRVRRPELSADDARHAVETAHREASASNPDTPPLQETKLFEPSKYEPPAVQPVRVPRQTEAREMPNESGSGTKTLPPDSDRAAKAREYIAGEREAGRQPTTLDVARKLALPPAVATRLLKDQKDAEAEDTRMRLEHRAEFDAQQDEARSQKAGSGIYYDENTAKIHHDPEALASAMQRIRTRGGNPDEWVKSAFDEERIHNLDALAARAGDGLQATRENVWNSLPEANQRAISDAYGPVAEAPHLSPEDQAKLRPNLLGAEYIRALAQRRAGQPITESHFRDTKQLEAVLDAPQPEAVEKHLAAMQALSPHTPATAPSVDALGETSPASPQAQSSRLQDTTPTSRESAQSPAQESTPPSQQVQPSSKEQTTDPREGKGIFTKIGREDLPFTPGDQTRPEEMTVGQFTAAAKRGRLGYNPRGAVVSPAQFDALKAKYGVTDAASSNNEPGFHTDIGFQYGYNSDDVAHFLSRSQWINADPGDPRLSQMDAKGNYNAPIPEKYIKAAHALAVRRAVERGVSSPSSPLATTESQEASGDASATSYTAKSEPTESPAQERSSKESSPDSTPFKRPSNAEVQKRASPDFAASLQKRINRTSNQWMIGEKDQMDLDPARSLSRVAIPKELGERFQGHGMQLGSKEASQLVDLLTKGIDPSRPFHSTDLASGDDGSKATGLGGNANSRSGVFTIVSKPSPEAIGDGQQFRTLGIGGVLVDDKHADLIPDLQREFPNVPFAKTTDAPNLMRELIAGSQPLKRPSNAEITKQTQLTKALEKATLRNPGARKMAEQARAKLTALQNAKNAPLQPGEKPRSFKLPEGPHGVSDALDHIKAEGRIIANDGSPEFDGAPKLAGIYNHSVYGGKMKPDDMATQLHENYGIGDGSVGEMWNAVTQAIEERKKARARQQEQDTAETQASRFSKDTGTKKKGEKTVHVGNLNVGDVLTVHGEKLTVTALDPDTLEVTLSDHSRYGVQSVSDDATLFVERIQKAKSSSDFAPMEDTSSATSKNSPSQSALTQSSPSGADDSRGKKLSEDQDSKSSPDFALESPTGKQLDAEKAKAAQKAKIEELRTRKLSAKELDTTGDMLDPEKADNPLFANAKGAATKKDSPFADQVAKAVVSIPTSERYGSDKDKVLISQAYDAYRAQKGTMNLAEFKQSVIAELPKGTLKFSRADLGTNDPKEAEERRLSKTEYLGETFHYIRTDGGAAMDRAMGRQLKAANPLATLRDVEDKYASRGVKSFASERGDTITLSKVVVPEDERSKGVGTAYMQDLTRYADANGKTVALTPSKDFGGSSVARLKDFYKRFGFTENKGKGRDNAISETMIRHPSGMNAQMLRAANPNLDYQGEHGAPDRESGAPLADLTGNGIYPADVYSAKGLQYYGTGEDAMDRKAFAIAQQFKGKPNAKVTIYRAVPYEPTNEEKIARYEEQKRQIMRRGNLPADADPGFTNSSKYYEHASNEIERLKSAPEASQPDYQINPGDWVSPIRQYVVDHGKSALNGKYQVLKKTVAAKDIYTAGDSWLEWGYDPASSEAVSSNGQGDGSVLQAGASKSPDQSGRVAPEHPASAIPPSSRAQVAEKGQQLLASNPSHAFTPEKGGILYHGTNAPEFKQFRGSKAFGGEYLAPDPENADDFSGGVIPGTSLHGETPGVSRVIKVQAKPGKALELDNDPDFNDALENGELDDYLAKKAPAAKAAGYRYLTHSHPSTDGSKDFKAHISLYPKDDLTPVQATPKVSALESRYLDVLKEVKDPLAAADATYYRIKQETGKAPNWGELRSIADKHDAYGQQINDAVMNLGQQLRAADPSQEQDEAGFYSQLSRSINALPQETMNVQQARVGIEKGSKPAEREFTGILTDPLSPLVARPLGAKVTKDELRDFAVERQAKTQTVTLGGPREVVRDAKGKPVDDGTGGIVTRGAPETHFSQYALPGADDGSYREAFVTWPQQPASLADFTAQHKRMYPAASDAQTQAAFAKFTERGGKLPDQGWEDGHTQYGDVTNPITRLRYNTRTDADGKKTLFLEEMQGPNASNQEKMPEFLRKRIYEIGMKRALRIAADEGVDRLSWTTGEQQAERYDLSKSVSEIMHWTPMFGKPGQTGIAVVGMDGKRVFEDGSLPNEKLESVVGKELAQKILAGEGDDNGSYKSIAGDGLKVGGGGLKRLYDNKLPLIANDLVKKFGVKVGTTSINPFQGEHPETGEPIDDPGDIVHSLDIPPALREHVQKGQQLFAANPLSHADDPVDEPTTWAKASDAFSHLMSRDGAIGSALDDIAKVFVPAARGEHAKLGAEALQEIAAIMARNQVLQTAVLKGMRNIIARKPQAQQREDIFQRDEGKSPDDPDYAKAFDAIKKLDTERLDEMKPELKKYGIDDLEDFHRYADTIIPHTFTDPDKAEQVFSNLEKKKLSGSTGFLKHRGEYTLRELSKLGLEPKSYNFVDLIAARWWMQERFLGALKLADEMEKAGSGHWETGDYVPKANEEEIGHRILRKTGQVDGKPRRQKFYAEKEAALIVKNYLSEGLRGKAWFQAYTHVANTLNNTQLSLSAFHGGFISAESITSQVANAIKLLADGDFAGAAKAALKAPISPILDYKLGKQLVGEWNKPGSQSDAIANMLRQIISGGGRGNMDSIYNEKATEKFMDALHSKAYSSAVLRAPFAAIELLARPITEKYVPYLKAAAAAKMIQAELARHPNASVIQQRSIAAEAVRSTNNRFGQMVYDNLHLHKVTKDILMGMTRSLGWNWGTFAELGGGVKDFLKAGIDLTPKIRKGGGGGKGGEPPEGPDGPSGSEEEDPLFSLGGVNVFKGKKPIFTQKMAYVLALPLVAGIMGAVINAAFGQKAHELKDYYFPKTGDKDAKGRDIRLSLPTYMKDVFAFVDSPTTTITNKLHPLLSMIGQMFSNKDFYGTEIRHQDDPYIKQAIQELKFVGKNLLPFTVTNLAKTSEEGASPAVKALGFVGFGKAAARIGETNAEKLADQLVIDRMPQGTRTQAEADKGQLKAKILNAARNKDLQPLRSALTAGTITSKEASNIVRRSSLTPLQDRVHSLDLVDAQRVLAVANADEKKELAPVVGAKIAAAQKASQPARQVAGPKQFAGFSQS